MSKELIVVVGAQFGSEGKGAICGHLGKSMAQNDVAIRVAGPNAGHTVIDELGKAWKLRAVPVAAVTSRCQLHIAAGSEVDLKVLMDEVDALDRAGHDVSQRLTVHPSATILTERHRSHEAARGLVARIGSTGKGIGAARSDRILRTAETFGELKDCPISMSEPGPFDLDDCGDVIIEGTQGYGLGLHTQYYPQVTSSDCRAIDFLAMAGISPWVRPYDLEVILVARLYPIRVAGNSGPLKGETSWQELGLPEERTTVTNKVRRVGEWDYDLVAEAIKANGGGNYTQRVSLALTMVDHKFPEVANKTELTDQAYTWVNQIGDALETQVSLVGTGPDTVVEL